MTRGFMAGARCASPRSAAGLTRRVQRGTDLLEQLLATVGFRNKTAKALRQHRPDLALLGESAAQYDIDLRIERAQLLEHRVAINHRQKVIENHQADFLAHALVNFERSK